MGGRGREEQGLGGWETRKKAIWGRMVNSDVVRMLRMFREISKAQVLAIGVWKAPMYIGMMLGRAGWS